MEPEAESAMAGNGMPQPGAQEAIISMTGESLNCSPCADSETLTNRLEEIIRSSCRSTVQSALQESVRSVVSEATVGIREAMLPSLRDLSIALRITCSSLDELAQMSKSMRDGEGSGSVSSEQVSASGSASSEKGASLQELPDEVRRALDVRIPSPQARDKSLRRRSPLEGLAARSDADVALGVRVLSPVVSQSASESKPHSESDGKQSMPSPPRSPILADEAGSGGSIPAELQERKSQARLAGRSSPVSVAEIHQSDIFPSQERQSPASENDKHEVEKIPNLSDVHHNIRDEVKHGEPGPQSHASGEERRVVEDNLVVEDRLFHAPAESYTFAVGNCGNDDGAGVQSEEVASFRNFEAKKARKGYRTPCSLYEMEDDCLMVSLEKIQQRKVSRKQSKLNKSRRPFSRVVPDGPGQSGSKTKNAPRENIAIEPSTINASEKEQGGKKYWRRHASIMDRDESDGSKSAPIDRVESGAIAERPGRIKTPRSLGQLRSDLAQNVLDDYTGFEQDVPTFESSGWMDTVCGNCLVLKFKELPEYCLVALGITQLGGGLASTTYGRFAFLMRVIAASLIIIKDFIMMDPTQVFYASFVHSVLALGALASTHCLWEGTSRALLGGRCDAIRMYARDNCFLDAWRTRSFGSFCFVLVIFAAQSILLLQILPGGIPEECEDFGLRNFDPSRHAANLLIVGVMAMLAFLHLRMCAGLQLMVDSFCEDFKMGMHEIRAGSQWNTIHGLMNKTASTIGTSFLIQISSFAAVLVLAGADVLVGNVKVDSDCAVPWLKNLVGPSLLGFLLLYVALIESGRLSFKCSCVAGFVSTVRYEEGTHKDAARQLRQYLVSFIHQTSSGFHIQGVRVTTFVAFKLGWAILTASFAIWAHSRST
eukprot:TRINITY_DN15604_c1_g1_i1.p1 TRINITY_DN15604_c1_g1~~TRINITY_DN15604_c1_g1_i1.p1  ORF type:complete len:896 (-),score=118.20 TRINITY_DN15604_c1_g1_i1:68-2716(-)